MSNLAANWLGATALMTEERVGHAIGDRPATEVAALLHTLYFGPVAVGRFAPVLRLTGPGAVRLLDRLEEERLVRRRPGQGRSVMVELTARGERLGKELQRQRLAVIDEMMEPLAPEEREEFGRLLGKVLFAAGFGPEEAARICRLCDHSRCDGRRCPVGTSLRSRHLPAPRTARRT